MNVFSSDTNSGTTIYVDPETITRVVDQNFTIDINIFNVTDLYGWEFKLIWNATMLNVTDVTEGPFLMLGGDTFFTYKINETEGFMIVDCTLLGDVPGVSGDGTLATIEFYAKNLGECTLDLYDTTLVSSNEQPIEHTASNGYCIICEPFHNIAITNVVPSKNIVGEGFIVEINVTVSNKGAFSETFNVTVYYNGSSITLPDGKDYVTVTLAAWSSTILTFTWNTTDVSKGNYTLAASATSVINETDTQDNNFIDGYIIVAMVGDITGPEGYPDGKVEIRDIAKVAKVYGISYPDPRYDPNCDLTGPIKGVADGKIDIRDIAVVAKRYGEIDP